MFLSNLHTFLKTEVWLKQQWVWLSVMGLILYILEDGVWWHVLILRKGVMVVVNFGR